MDYLLVLRDYLLFHALNHVKENGVNVIYWQKSINTSFFVNKKLMLKLSYCKLEVVF